MVREEDDEEGGYIGGEDDEPFLDDENTPIEPRLPYEHRQGDVAEIARVVDSIVDVAAGGRGFEEDLAVALDGTCLPPGVEDEIRNAWWYRLKVDRDGPAAGASLQPLNPIGVGVLWPVPIRSVSAAVRDLWVALSSATTSPIARARFNDLSFSAGVSGAGEHARAAVVAYLLWPTTGIETREISVGFLRAWTLARLLGDGALESRCYVAVRALARQQLANEPMPGTLLPLLDLLSSRPSSNSREGPDDEIRELLADAHGEFKVAYVRARVAAMRRRLARDAGERDAINAAEVLGLLEEAEGAANDFLRLHFLEAAAQMASRHHLRDLEAEATALLQKVNSGDLPFIRVEVASTLKPWDLESFLRPYELADDWRGALGMFLSDLCPSGEYERNLEFARGVGERSLVQKLFSTKRFGGHGLPERTVAGDDDHLDYELVKFELLEMENYGRLYAEALGRIQREFGRPPRTDVVAFVADAYGSEPVVANAFALALDLFWAAEHVASVHVAVPKIEAGVRGLLEALDVAVYRVEVGNRHGQFAPLGALLPRVLEHGFDPDWERFLGTFLLPRGWNFRNLMAHGFVDHAWPMHSALALRALGLMATLVPASGQTDAPGVAELFTSLGVVRPGRLDRFRLHWRALRRRRAHAP